MNTLYSAAALAILLIYKPIPSLPCAGDAEQVVGYEPLLNRWDNCLVPGPTFVIFVTFVTYAAGGIQLLLYLRLLSYAF